MSDIIRLLPDSVANQIAAGEVIQRPASAVKELIENAIDAGASQITLVVKEAGKVLIQITDNGCGMTDTDARMCFERHATSKISKAEDLFAIRTMGFRGEAMASIAAVAQVELKTVPHDAATGTRLVIEGSRFVSQEPVAGPPGTTIAVRNLFFNIPARRNFLKSNASELRHVIDEFQRVAIARPDIGFVLFSDGAELFHLKPGNLRQRLTALFGSNYNERLVPVEEHTTILGLGGFIVKPEFSRKTRGEQFFFVNGRFIKDSYLHHAVTNAYESLLPPGTFPSYFLLIEIDPARIDINIHPTKTEIKFEDEKSVYAILRAAIKRALGKFSVTPTLDFEQEQAFNIPVTMYGETPKAPVIQVNPSYNPFRQSERQDSFRSAPLKNLKWNTDGPKPIPAPLFEHTTPEDLRVLAQLTNRYVVAMRHQELLLIDRQAAHERVLYEQHLAVLQHRTEHSQQQLFPQVLEFSRPDAVTVESCLDDLKQIGFDLSHLGNTSYAVNGLPIGIAPNEAQPTLERMMEHYRSGSGELASGARERLARSSASAMAIRPGEPLPPAACNQLVTDLFQCEQPGLTPGGKRIFIRIANELIQTLFTSK